MVKAQQSKERQAGQHSAQGCLVSVVTPQRYHNLLHIVSTTSIHCANAVVEALCEVGNPATPFPHTSCKDGLHASSAF